MFATWTASAIAQTAEVIADGLCLLTWTAVASVRSGRRPAGNNANVGVHVYTCGRPEKETRLWTERRWEKKGRGARRGEWRRGEWRGEERRVGQMRHNGEDKVTPYCRLTPRGISRCSRPHQRDNATLSCLHPTCHLFGADSRPEVFLGAAQLEGLGGGGDQHLA